MDYSFNKNTVYFTLHLDYKTDLRIVKTNLQYIGSILEKYYNWDQIDRH